MVNHKFSLRATTASLIALSTLTGCVSTGSLFGHHDVSSPQASYEETLRVAASARESGDLATSAEMYGRAASFATTDVGPLIQLADVYWQMKNPAKSAETLEKARALDASNVLVLRNLGRAYVATGDIKKAEDAYLAALQIDSTDVRIHNGLGVAYDLDGDHTTAQDHFREGLKIAPNDLDLRNNLAYSFISADSYDQAIKLLEPVYLAGQSTPRLRQNLALAYALADRDPEARKVAGEDLSPAEVERNMAVYNHLRDNGASRQDMMAMGRPTFTRGGLNPITPKPLEVAKTEAAPATPAPAAEPVVSTDAANVPPVTAPTEITLTPAADQSTELAAISSTAPQLADHTDNHTAEPVVVVTAPPEVTPPVVTATTVASAPIDNAPPVVATVAAAPEPEIKLASASGESMQSSAQPTTGTGNSIPVDLSNTAPTATSQVAALPVAKPTNPTPAPAVPSPPLEVPTIPEVSAPAAIEPSAAPAVIAGADLSAPSSTIGFGGPKVYLGQFANESEARETWIKVWTDNSALLGSLVASIEPSNNKTALFAVGSGSSEQAADICVKLRAAGVSCGVAK